jgi:hypothetical protein
MSKVPGPVENTDGDSIAVRVAPDDAPEWIAGS